MAKEIGSEFWEVPLQDNENSFFPESCLWFLSGRVALMYILKDIKKRYGIKKASLPSWCCDSMIKPFLETGFSVDFYSVYMSAGKLCKNIPDDSELLLVLDYFGFCDSYDYSDYNGIVIRDLTHSVFCKNYTDADYYFGSLRKWCGIWSGGFAFGKGLLFENTEIVQPDLKYVNLRKESMEKKALYISGKSKSKDFLSGFNEAEEILDSINTVGSASERDVRLSRYLDIGDIKEKRRENAKILLDSLQDIAVFPKMNEDDCPLFIPVAVKSRDKIKGQLIENGIYCPVHWPITKLHKLNDYTRDIYDKEISLICDQRYTKEDMYRIVEVMGKGTKLC